MIDFHLDGMHDGDRFFTAQYNEPLSRAGWCSSRLLRSWPWEICATPTVQTTIAPRPLPPSVHRFSPPGGGVWRVWVRSILCAFNFKAVHYESNRNLPYLRATGACAWLRGGRRAGCGSGYTHDTSHTTHNSEFDIANRRDARRKGSRVRTHDPRPTRGFFLRAFIWHFFHNAHYVKLTTVLHLPWVSRSHHESRAGHQAN